MPLVALVTPTMILVFLNDISSTHMTQTLKQPCYFYDPAQQETFTSRQT